MRFVKLKKWKVHDLPKKRICHSRCILQSFNIQKISKNRVDIILEYEWDRTADNEPFCSTGINDHMILFTTKEELKCLAECRVLYVDGTFKMCPSLYAQMYSIHGLFHDHVIPLVYSLLSEEQVNNITNVCKCPRCDGTPWPGLESNLFHDRLRSRSDWYDSAMLSFQMQIIWAVIFILDSQYGEKYKRLD